MLHRPPHVDGASQTLVTAVLSPARRLRGRQSSHTASTAAYLLAKYINKNLLTKERLGMGLWRRRGRVLQATTWTNAIPARQTNGSSSNSSNSSSFCADVVRTLSASLARVWVGEGEPLHASAHSRGRLHGKTAGDREQQQQHHWTLGGSREETRPLDCLLPKNELLSAETHRTTGE